jgi:hypothetical protein
MKALVYSPSEPQLEQTRTENAMRATSKLLALALTATMQSAMAGAVFLDFEDVQTTELLTTRYGSKGVTASGAAWTAASEACGGDVSFIRTGSCGALWLAEDPTNTAATSGKSLTLSVADGFVDALSFIYSGSILGTNLAVHVYDAAGKELGQGLSGLTGAGCGTFIFCNWSQTVSLSFQGVARTVVFSATDQTVLLDDINFQTADPNGRLPEPTSIALALGALGGLGWARRRAAR